VSYAAVDLGIGILELFVDAARTKPPPIRSPINLWRAYEHPQARPKLSIAERRRRKKERRRREEATARAQRVAEREKNYIKFVRKPQVPRPVAAPFPYYLCSTCRSTAPAHRCPG
jgi:hypothetical protein